MMPVGSVQSIAFVEIHDIRHIRKEISWSMHVAGTDFDIDLVLSCHSGSEPGARGNDKGIYNRIPFVGVHTLICEIHIDPALTISSGVLGGGRGRCGRFTGRSIGNNFHCHRTRRFGNGWNCRWKGRLFCWDLRWCGSRFISRSRSYIQWRLDCGAPGAEEPLSAFEAENALTSIGAAPGLAISAGAHRISCVGAALKPLTMEAIAGRVNANKANNPTTKQPAPINKAGNNQFLPWGLSAGIATAV